MKSLSLKSLRKFGLIPLSVIAVAQLHAQTFDGLEGAHVGGFEDGSKSPPVEPADVNLIEDIQELKRIGEVTALIPEASTADEESEHSVDGQGGDTDYPFATFKALATVGEYDPVTGLPLTGYPDGHAAWLVDEDTVRVAYQSESYAFGSNETYPWQMANGATFTGSHVHTIDYDRAMFADFLGNDASAAEMFVASGHLFDTVYNVLGNKVEPKSTATAGEYWGKQMLPDGTLVSFSTPLVGADYYFHSLCGAHLEKADRYGEGIGFADDVFLNAEEWNIGDSRYADGVLAIDTMGLASMVTDVANGVSYTVPALGQSGYEKLLPVNPGSPDHVVIVCAGYNFDQPNDTAPLRIYVGMKGMDADGNPVDQEGAASERDKFLARNGLLYGKVYGMALANADYDTLNLTAPDAAALEQLRGGDKSGLQLLDAYLEDETAPDSFSVRYYPTSYQWAGWGIANAVSVAETEATKWFEDAEQPTDYTFFPADDKVEHPAVDPDHTKFRFIQNMTNKGGLLGIEFSDLVAELTADADLPDYISADVTRIVAAVDGSLTLEVADKGISHDGTNTAAGHVELDNVHKMAAPDGLQWIRSADADVLIVDEDSGNDYGERKYAIVIDPETLDLAEPGKGYFLAMAGGKFNPRAVNEVSAYGGTFWRADSSEFSGSWNVTGLIARKAGGGFYSQAELAGTGEQQIIETFGLEEQTLIGVVQHRGESGGAVAKFRADWGGQLFMFGIRNINILGGAVTFDPGFRGSATGGGSLVQSIRAGEALEAPVIEAEDGWVFTGWDTEFDAVSGTTTITAQYAAEDTIDGIEAEAHAEGRILGQADVVGSPSTYNLYTSSEVAAAEVEAKTLVNISNRVELSEGEEIIAGFVVTGEDKTVLIRAVGPKLADFGVVTPLADPTMTLYRAGSDGGADVEVATVDDWQEGGADVPAINAAMVSVGAFPLEDGGDPLATDDTASAVALMSLEQGVYTVVVTSAAEGETGVVLVEVYEVFE